MRVRVVRSGGFAGLRAERVADERALAPDDARLLALRVAEARVSELPERLGAGVPDANQYDVTVEADGRTFRVRGFDVGMPAALLRLVEFVLERGVAP